MRAARGINCAAAARCNLPSAVHCILAVPPSSFAATRVNRPPAMVTISCAAWSRGRISSLLELLVLLLLLSQPPRACANKTVTWLEKRNKLIGSVYGEGEGVLPSQSIPDSIVSWPSEPKIRGLVWNISNGLFPITSTVFHAPLSGDPEKLSDSAFLFHHGHSDCVCEPPKGASDPDVRHLVWQACKPGCNSSMPSHAETADPGYSWWDLYNVSTYFHSLGYDVFILSMPLKGINYGLGYDDNGTLIKNETGGAVDHWWFQQWEDKGDAALRYFLEPAYLTVNYAKSKGYDFVGLAGLSGGGWSTTVAAAIVRHSLVLIFLKL
jgi:hypothetical protein